MRTKKVLKKVSAGLLTSSLLAGTVLPAFAGQQLGQTNFDNGVGLPWHTCESGPAKLTFDLAGGSFNVTIVNPGGVERGGESWWDAQLRHRKLTIVKGHKYTISYELTATKSGAFKTKISNFGGDPEDWHNTQDEDASPPISNGSSWDAISVTANTKYSGKGSFTAPADIPAAEWAFHFGGKGEWNTGGDAFPANYDAGETVTLKFDNMSLIDTTSSQNDWVGAVNPYDDQIHNAVRINQVGYYTNLQKKASVVLANGDTASYPFTVVNKSGQVVFTGTTTAGGADPDSGQQIAVLDFSALKETGDGFVIKMGAGYTAPAAAGLDTIKTKIGSTESYPFSIKDNLYKNAAANSATQGFTTNDYNGGQNSSLFTNAINYFYQNRAGIDLVGTYITSGDNKTAYPGAVKGGDDDKVGALQGKAGLIRPHSADHEKAYIQDSWVKSYSGSSAVQKTASMDTKKGWFDAGDHGKYVVNGGISVWTLANVYERADKSANGDVAGMDALIKIPEAGGTLPNMLDEVKWELDFFFDMVVKPTHPSQKPYISEGSNGAAMDMTNLVYHKTHDYAWTGLAMPPDADKLVRLVKPPSTAATLNLVATFAQAARLFQPFDAAYAAKLLDQAKASYTAAKTVKFQGDYIYAPLDQAIGGGAYGDNEVRDDFYWAACELYITTKDAAYKSDLSAFSIPGQSAFEITSELKGGENNGSFTSFNWGNTAGLGTLSLWLNRNEPGLLTTAEITKIETSIKAIGNDFLAEQANQKYGIPYKGAEFTDPINAPGITFNGYEWGSNSFVINNAIVLAYAYDVSGDVKYINGVVESMDYILGRNAMDFSYITGYGTYHLVNPHHRWWSHENDPNFPLAPAGVLSGGANLGMQDPYIKGAGFDPLGTPSQFCFIDSIESWSTNEVTVNWNSPLVWVVKYLDDVVPTVGDYIPPEPTATATTTTTTGVTTTTTPGGTTTQGPNPTLLGDVDLSGAVNVVDVVLLAKHVASKTTLSGVALANANCNIAPGVDSIDLQALIKHVLEGVTLPVS